MIEWLKQPWPWYVAGAIVGLTVPALLLLGNKHFGISANLRHMCAACFPARIKFFQYNWKREAWNLFFVGGILIGGIIAALFLQNDTPIKVNPALVTELAQYGITDYSQQVPADLYSWSSLFTLRGFLLLVGGGFLVGFGTRYAIMGISTLQIPSVIATICFMVGGFLMANWILPFILQL